MFIKNKRGQIAIFVVLVFQVLFILFAMTINVALVVHDKINFQNSLDLAAYYGAKQQAEVLSAMAHINYQMRQNWKLLAWRYRILGTLLQDKKPIDPYWCPQSVNNNYECTSNDCRLGMYSPPTPTQIAYIQQCINACDTARSALPYGNYCDLHYFVCISHKIWKRGVNSSNQNLCTKEGVYIPAIDPVTTVGGLMGGIIGAVNIAQTITANLQREVSASCPMEGALNWFMAQVFLTHFRLDQKDRKTMLRKIYKKTFKEGKDLDGKSIFDGAKKVFYRNLTKANQENVKNLTNYGLEQFDSFFSKNKDFTDVFEHLNVWPVLQYADFGTNTNISACEVTLRPHHKIFGGNYPAHWAEMVGRLLTPAHNSNDPHPIGVALRDPANDPVKIRFSFNHKPAFDYRGEDENNPIASLTLGFYKKTDQILYYGLKGKFDYLSKNQIFSLNLSPSITFKASSFAKPFGGRFGPQPDKGDPLIPTHDPLGDPSLASETTINSALLQPNYSRWPGDNWGLLDWNLHSNDSDLHFLRKKNGIEKSYYIDAFFHLIFDEGPHDPLARPFYNRPNDLKKNFMRMMELMAVYPDVFDLSHYSIASNYMQTYFPRICKLLLELPPSGSYCTNTGPNKIPGTNNFQAYIRGDFGWPETHYMSQNKAKKRRNISVAPYFLKANNGMVDSSEITHFKGLTSGPIPINPFPTLTKGKIFYDWLAQDLPAHLLSSWAPTEERERYEVYTFPKNKFLKCNEPAATEQPVPSSCAIGGRSDYSVKLISCETVNDFDPDSKPSNLPEYCPN